MTPVGMAAMKPFLQFLPSRLSIDSTGQHCTLLRPNLRISQNAVNRIFPPQSVAASTVSVVETKPDLALDNGKLINCKNVLACPICYKPLISNSDFDSSRGLAIGFELRCKTCRREYSENESHFDLTITGGGNIYGEALPASTELFRSPLVSFLYERGWRQSFSLWGGFPGPEKEFELIKEYLAPVLGGIIIDASCASGVFSRLFAKSGLFSLVFALDFSETMLQQCYEFITQDENFPTEKIILVRADISRLPFASGSVDAVHAGAALHCWPSPSLVASVKVLAIFCDEDKVRRAGPGENLRVRLSGVEEEEILSGFVLCSHAKPIPAVSEFFARLQILELVENAIFTAGYKAVLHIHAAVEECEIVELTGQIDPKTRKPMKKKPLFVKNGAAVLCRVQVNNLICIEKFEEFPQLGRFTLRTEGKTVAVGIVTGFPSLGDGA